MLTTDVECEVVSSPDNAVVLGSNWLFAWREVWRSQLGRGPKRMTRFDFEFVCKMRVIWLVLLLQCC